MWQDQVVAHCVDPVERSKDVWLTESIAFDELLLSKEVLSGLKKSGFHTPSPIQLKSIPLGRCGLDLIVQAKSGTGKTCVFSVIALDAVNVASSSLQVIVLAPTREIALQIHGVISCIGQDLKGLAVQAFIGGTLVSDDRVKAKKCQIAIGSPGRLKQLIELGILETRNVRIFVLDEADKLVEEGSFQKQINWIYSTLPTSKQMLALSATYPEELAVFLSRYMREPTYVRLDASHLSLLGLRQYYRVVEESLLPHLLFEEKANEVIQVLSCVSFQQALVFSNYHSRAESVCEALCSNGWPSTFISGNMEQSRRTEAINKLKQFKCRILISTDLTSRGIDAQNVDLVINMDLPQDWETYLHRIGRAGRYGSRGIAVSLVSAGEEEKKLHSIANQCNATILPLSDLNQLREHMESNPTSKTIVNSKNVESVITEYSSSKQQLHKSPSISSIDTSQSACQDSASHCSNKSVSRDQSGESRDRNTVPIGNGLASQWDKFNERAFLVKFVNCPEPPLIPSVKELQSKIDRLQDNMHYRTMSYSDLKADFEYFDKTGKFAAPPETKETSIVEDLESELSKMTTYDRENSSSIADPGFSTPAVTETPLHRAMSHSVDLSKKEPITVSSIIEPNSCSNNTTESSLHPTKNQSSANSTLNQTSKTAFPSLSEPSVCKTVAESSSRPAKNQSCLDSASNGTPKAVFAEKDKATNKSKSVHAKRNGLMRVIRQRHPQCAAAGLDSLKHWSEVEKENSKFPTAPTKNASRFETSLKAYKPSVPLENPICCGRKEYEYSSKNTDLDTDSSSYTSDSDFSSNDSEYEESENDFQYSESETATSSFTMHPSSAPNYSLNQNDLIPPPPLLLQFGPTGHCFNPFLCTHPTNQDLSEAVIAHQVYHHALQHARQEVFRFCGY